MNTASICLSDRFAQKARTPGRPPGSSRFSPALAPPTSSARYVRHRPETTLLYHVVREYWPEFQAELANQGKHLPAFICREFDEYLKCGRLGHGFLRIRCEACHDEKLVAFSCKRRGFCPSCGARRMAESAIATHLRRKAGYTKATAHTGAVTLIQRFGSAGKAKIAVCRRQEAVLVCR